MDDWDAAHIIFPDMCVASKDEARAWSERLLENTGLVFDKSVYSSGLRMIGSRKKRDISRVYSPYMCMEDNDTLEDISSHGITARMLNLCSIHAIPGTPTAPRITTGRAPKLSNKAKGAVEVFLDSTDAAKVSKFKDGCYYMFTKDTYCENLKRKHKTACAFFQIDIKTRKMRRRCMCRCADTGCEAYRGEWVPMPIKLFYDIKNNVKPGEERGLDHHNPSNLVHRADDLLDNLFG